MTDIYILSATRTAIGGFGGSLSGLSVVDLATHVTAAALEQADLRRGLFRPIDGPPLRAP